MGIRQVCFVALSALLVAPAESDEPPGDDDVWRVDLVRSYEDVTYPAGKPFAAQTPDCRYFEHAIADYVHYDALDRPVFVLASFPTEVPEYKLLPSVLNYVEGVWTYFPVPIATDGWNFVHVSDDERTIVAIMDNVQQSGGWDSRFVISRNGGKTWHYGDRIRKYCYSNSISHFAMDEDGTGTAIEYNDGGTGGYERVGYFVSRTHDWGKTWSGIEHEEAIDEDGYVQVTPLLVAMRRSRVAVRDLDPGLLHQCLPRTSP